jgi:lactoylglutathione lyase
VLLLNNESEFRSNGRTTVPLLIFGLLHRAVHILRRRVGIDRSDHRTNLVPLRHPKKQEMAPATERTVSELQEQVHPTEPRWTHIALRVSDIDATIAWHAEFSPLELIDRREDEMGYGAWLGMPGKTNNPFILVLAQFFEDKDPFAGTPRATLAPFAHFGIELPTKQDVDEMAERGKQGGCLAMPPTMMPQPIGYITMLRDPDGNMVEFSWDQGVFSRLHELWGQAD